VIKSIEVIAMATTIQVRVDNEMKAAAESLFGSLGFDISSAVRMFLSAAIAYKGLPFEVRQYNAETIQALEDTMNGRNLYGPFDTVDEMMASLVAEDPDDEYNV
jgi:DNA-damage-inducible protein J